MTSPSDCLKPSIVFFGTPAFALPSLEALVESGVFSIKAVITQPDKPTGRGQRISPPPVKSVALKHSIPIFQPASLKSLRAEKNEERVYLSGEKSCKELAQFLSELTPIDFGVSVAYGKILPPALLDFPRHGIVNVHPSLLPRWRGAAPLQRALFNGDSVTGVSTMLVERGLDTGPVFSRQEMPIEPDETLGTLHDKLACLGGEMLVHCLPKIARGDLSPEAQDENGATYAEKWGSEDLVIDWAQAAEITIRRIRTCSPFPGARTSLKGLDLKIYAAHQVADQNFQPSSPGTIVEVNRAEMIVAARQGEFIGLEQMQFPGKKRLSIPDIIRGRNIDVGDRFV